MRPANEAFSLYRGRGFLGVPGSLKNYSALKTLAPPRFSRAVLRFRRHTILFKGFPRMWTYRLTAKASGLREVVAIQKKRTSLTTNEGDGSIGCGAPVRRRSWMTCFLAWAPELNGCCYYWVSADSFNTGSEHLAIVAMKTFERERSAMYPGAKFGHHGPRGHDRG